MTQDEINAARDKILNSQYLGPDGLLWPIVCMACRYTPRGQAHDCMSKHCKCPCKDRFK